MLSPVAAVLLLALGAVSGSAAPALSAATEHPSTVRSASAEVAASSPAPTPGAEGAAVAQAHVAIAEGQAAAAGPDPASTAPAVPASVEDLTARTVIGDRVVTAAIDTSTVESVGLTWPTGETSQGIDPRIRTQDAGTKRWGPWTQLSEEDGAPDAASADRDHSVRAGTDPVWTGKASAIQLSFAASSNDVPADLSLALVKRTPTASSTRPAAYRSSTSGLVSGVDMPAVVSRAQWGAMAPVCTPDVAGSLWGAAVHHTADPNTYSTQADAMAMIRADQAYHIVARGWCDLGYNFVVDKWGTIYEGRANSLVEPVIGVHAGGFNTGTVGVAMLGTYTDVAPSDAMVSAVGRIIGWRLGAYHVDPTSWNSVWTGNGENSRFSNQTVSLPRIFGHRDVAYTACPGDLGYAALDRIRQIAAATASTQNFDEARAMVRQLYQDVLHRSADPGGLDLYATELANGMTPAQLATILVHSPEYAATSVTADYQQALGRAPDPVGFADWTAKVVSGQIRAEDLRLWLYSSVEFYQQAGGTDDGYVRSLYRHVLGRDASSGEVSTWAPVAAKLGSAAILGGVWGSYEGGTVRVQAFYQRYLGRAADPAGIQTWVPDVLSHGEDSLRSDIVGSLEYYLRAQAAAV